MVVPPARSPQLRLVPPPPAAGAEDRALSDGAVLAALDHGGSARMESLYEHLIGVVDATLYRVLGRREQDHDDLVQSVFEQVLITLRRKRFAGACSLRSWAASIACHVALNALRSRGTERKFVQRDEAADVTLRHVAADDDPERGTELARELAELRAALAALPPAQAETLLLHDALGYELSEIAVLTNTSVAAAQSRLVRGRKALRKLLVSAGPRSEVPA